MRSGIVKQQLISLYEAEREGRFHLLSNLTRRVGEALYPLVLEEATYIDKGARKYLTGGTPALKSTCEAFVRFIKAFERGEIELWHIDGVIWACHNNGVLADLFILDCAGEDDALRFLDELSGITRGD